MAHSVPGLGSNHTNFVPHLRGFGAKPRCSSTATANSTWGANLRLGFPLKASFPQSAQSWSRPHEILQLRELLFLAGCLSLAVVCGPGCPRHDHAVHAPLAPGPALHNLKNGGIHTRSTNDPLFSSVTPGYRLGNGECARTLLTLAHNAILSCSAMDVPLYLLRRNSAAPGI